MCEEERREVGFPTVGEVLVDHPGVLTAGAEVESPSELCSERVGAEVGECRLFPGQARQRIRRGKRTHRREEMAGNGCHQTEHSVADELEALMMMRLPIERKTICSR